MSADYSVGDRVKVTLEGEVAGIADAGEKGTLELRVQVDGQDHFVYTDTATVEKVEPPVETFKPGDVVRDIQCPKYFYTVGKSGYLDHQTGRFYEDKYAFTSRQFERIEI